jgi:hypothetical protein
MDGQIISTARTERNNHERNSNNYEHNDWR